MFVQTPDGLIINCDHIMKIRKIDHVLEDGESSPFIWMKYVTGEEEKIGFTDKAQRAEWYQNLKSAISLQSF